MGTVRVALLKALGLVCFARTGSALSLTELRRLARLRAMLTIVLTFVATLRSTLQTRQDLVLENLALRHQLAVLARSEHRPRLRPPDRLLWICLRRFWTGWKDASTTVSDPAPVWDIVHLLPASRGFCSEQRT